MQTSLKRAFHAVWSSTTWCMQADFMAVIVMQLSSFFVLAHLRAVSSGTLNPSIPYHTISMQCCLGITYFQFWHKFAAFIWSGVYYAPPLIGGGICLTSVCLTFVAYIGPKSRTERPRKTKIGTEVVHVTRDLDTTFRIKRSMSPGRFVGRWSHYIMYIDETSLYATEPLPVDHEYSWRKA